MNELELLKKRITREIAARKAAEAVIESKALELFHLNNQLQELNQALESKVQERTQQLTESERQYRLLVESAKEIIYYSNPEGYITYTNAMAEQVLGYSKEEFIGKHFTDFMPPEFMEEVMNYYITMRDNEVEDSYMEVLVLSKEGKAIWFGQNVKRIEQEDELVFSIVARDITERKEIEAALEIAQKTLSLSEQKYRSMIENMKLGILEVDLDGKVVKAYKGFCDMVEYEPEELVGLNPESFLLNDRARDIIASQHEKREKGIADIYEIPITTKSGKEKWMLISGAPFYNLNDEVVGSIGIHYDITYQKTLQKQLEIAKKKAEKAQAAEKQFLANMSHEIRTPLNAIIGMAHLLNDTTLDAEQKEFLDILSNSANLLHTLISDILDISKIDAGHIEKKLIPVNLPRLVGNVVNSFSMKAREKGIALELTIDKEIHTQLLVDELLLNQILINLVGNAVKFTHQGSVFVRVRLLSEKGDTLKIRFEVEDTGIGIPEKMHSVIFEKFRQVSDDTMKKYKGTGLGLSITRSLVEILEGNIHFQSNEGVGTRFIVDLPFTNVGKELEASEMLPLAGDVWKFADQKVLIAEDNAMNQKYISTLMKKWGIDFDLVEDGEDAVHHARMKAYDLIFMDLQMPRLDGLEATRQIMEKSLNQSTPIVALTASTFLTKKQMALSAGMKDFLSKPFTPPQLSAVLNRYLSVKTVPAPKVSGHFRFSNNLDTSALNEIYGDDIEYAYDMFTLFLDQCSAEFTTLENLVDAKSSIQVKRQAHKMKPTYRMVGLSHLCQILAEIEQTAEKDQSNGYTALFEQFSTDFKKSIKEVQKEQSILKNQIAQ